MSKHDKEELIYAYASYWRQLARNTIMARKALEDGDENVFNRCAMAMCHAHIAMDKINSRLSDDGMQIIRSDGCFKIINKEVEY